MGKFLDRFRKRANPSDEETAEAMRNLADAFVRGAAAEGTPFGWEPDEASRLDDICDAFLASDPPAAHRHSMIMSMGAYLGELMVRHGGGRWAFDAQEEAAVVEMPNGLRAFPHNKVAKRLDHGREHNLFAFYWYGLTRQTPPDTAVRVLPDGG
ncbi:hypothetical protein [Catellatospora chokoriensis]|uniref:DUF3806 domain-containing protein n=1 Tax=Catellatospora chokoriensis TaxID=310353 RepID=A0A8J3JV59_9ACTN|nr:hypothetical protein [Catellatospora chokoriensis]GIF89099.1 hypothetical protein Cch02nite_25430 [Catellatospora chokoriensis]